MRNLDPAFVGLGSTASFGSAANVRFGSDFDEKVESQSFAEIRLNGSEIFGLIWLPLQIDYGHLGLTRPRIVRPPLPSQETKPRLEPQASVTLGLADGIPLVLFSDGSDGSIDSDQGASKHRPDLRRSNVPSSFGRTHLIDAYWFIFTGN